MQYQSSRTGGRIGLAAAVVLVLVALGLYFYSERAAPPETEFEMPAEAEQPMEPRSSGPPGTPITPIAGEGSSGGAAPDPGESDRSPGPGRPESEESGRDAPARARESAPEPEISLDRQQQQLREDLSVRLGPGQIDMIVDTRLLERLVTTVNSLDGDPVPLRFRPLAHVPGLPRLEQDDGIWRLPEAPDPRYRPYRALFDGLGVVELAELFDRYEPALEKAWQSLGEHSGQTFRARALEILGHLAEFEPPAVRPTLHQPKVLYEYIDPQLEQLSWGRKVLVRIGPAHASSVQRKLGALAERLERRGG